MKSVKITKPDTRRDHSIDIQNIIDSPPRWLIRWGIAVTACFLLLFILLSRFISCPDVVPLQVSLYSLNPPQPVMAKTCGKLKLNGLKNEQMVSANQLLATIYNGNRNENVRAHKSGQLVLPDLIRQNMEIRPGQKIFEIVDQSQVFYGEMEVPLQYIHRLSTGKLIDLSVKWPHANRSLPMVKGRIGFMAPNTSKVNFYTVEVKFINLNSRLTHERLKIDADVIAETNIGISDGTLYDKIIDKTNNFIVRQIKIDH